ncbi:protein CHAPERONE-LIKE PROTEIN OF POR1, chloroplastic [Quillaja saponaria]|uniref:Protein CHAPERONE-LIKE PROTEIN OF POR1, chloroplastic n=1 Tax=Quillaja saponaria TaxID=32244 RepID=A0AAD7L7Q3_QUISA|nr:protein CHAPERONE-LIKE PROTEIN OF POR1, chloroplastic [Quillaja saponaria]
MYISGLSGSPSRCSRCCLQLPVRGLNSLYKRVPVFSSAGKDKVTLQFFQMEKAYWAASRQRYTTGLTLLIKSAMDASYGDVENGSTAVFPRIDVRDPYK